MKRMEESVSFSNWAKELWWKYGCRIFVFEPVKKFAHDIAMNLHPEMTGAVTIINRGLGSYPRWEAFSVHGDSTGAFSKNGPFETVEILAIGPIIESWPEIALLKLNVEGMEYEILEALIAQDLMPRIVNLQVQFHRIPGSDRLIEEITQGLKQTHELVYHEPYCWEGWKRK